MSFHEPYASSACELMTELLEELVEQPDILRVEAEAMLSGIMLDTKDFTVRTGERTFEAAAFLRPRRGRHLGGQKAPADGYGAHGRPL